MIREDKNHIQIALAGNPNSGKTSLFNALTGLHQKVGNFPGVTVDRKTGSFTENNLQINVIDLPGTYSLYPRRADEWVAYKVLMNVERQEKIDMVVLVLDASNLKRNLLFCTQLIDLKYPIIVALTMNDLVRKKGIKINIDELSRKLGVPVIPVNPRTDEGVSEIKKAIAQQVKQLNRPRIQDFIDVEKLAPAAIQQLKEKFAGINNYQAIHYLVNYAQLPFPQETKNIIAQIVHEQNFNPTKTQATEILERYTYIRRIIQQTVTEPDLSQKKLFTDKLDDILLHRVWSYVILLVVLFLLFQSIFWLAQYPMNLIDWSFTQLNSWLSSVLPKTWWSDFICNGFLAGLGGIVIFIPQIMILFGLITILEDTGYMARISFLTDKLMRKAGLNGKSIMPMISGYACAVPGIMSARNIENKKERLITILVTPLMSCSARLPVYTMLIALVAPNKYYWGIFSERGLIIMLLYLLGLIMALVVSYISKWIIKTKEKSFFILELPIYRAPRWKNVGVTMLEKAKIFVFRAGKIILIISLLLWFLSSYGPAKEMQAVKQKYEILEAKIPPSNTAAIAQLNRNFGTEKLENSYAGYLGKFIEPVIKPLGYDWKIGIALITSFAAREVFVGTMATLYSVDENNSSTFQEKMRAARRDDGTPVYTVATAMSLLIFYVFAMQCISTLSVVKRETRSWKYPIIQFLYMTGSAYIFSLLTYHLLAK